MRKNKNFALGTAALLLSTAGFTACSSEDAFTGSSLSGEAVKTQFAINIPTSGVKGRMSAENTQNNGNFLGMHNIQLIPMTIDAATQSNPAPTFSSVVNLGNIGNSELSTTSSTKVYTDVNVPVGTTRFLFYGAGFGEAYSSDYFAKGILDQQINGSAVSDISFSLRSAKVEDTGNQQGTLQDALNAVITAFGETYTADAAKDTPDTQLGTLCKKFTQLTAGSANSIKQTLEALSNALAAISGTEATDAGNIKTVVDNQKTAIDKFTYPANINMPDGAAVVNFSNGAFAYVSGSIGNAGTVNLPLDMGKVCYPASIYYFVNTPLLATNDSKGTTGWPTSSSWVNNEFFNGWGTEVLSTTHTIALKNPIQYGVAQLALTAKCSGSLLEDSKENKVSVPSKGYTITGVLIGGQPDVAGWDFTPKSESFTQVVYDKAIDENVAAMSNSVANGINYTLVLDNDNKTTTQNVVNIAVEFVNNGAEFYGANGQVIPAGAKFYLIAQLNPTAGVTGVTIPDGLQNPHVFMQDYTTTANLTIKSLANAYNTIPDLRASELSLGLTVDLNWTSGIKFDVDFN